MQVFRSHAALTRVLGSSGTAASVTGTTDETQLASIVIPAGAMGANGKIRVTTFWSYTNSVNNKTMRVRFGGSGGTSYLTATVTTTATFFDGGRVIANAGAANSQRGVGTTALQGASGNAVSTGTVDTSAATTLYISGQLTNTGETITLESYLVELIPGV